MWFCFCLWGAAAGVDVSVVDGLLGSVSGGVGAWGGCASLRSSALVVASSSGFVPLVWFCCWFCFFCVFAFGVCWWWGLVLAFVIGVLGWVLARGVVSGGGVVAGWWAGVVGRVRALVSGVGAWGLVLAGLVGVVVLVSVLVLVG